MEKEQKLWYTKDMKKFDLKDFLFKFCLIAGFIALDLVSKTLFAKYFSSNPNIIIIPGLLELTYFENSGASFGIFADKTIYLTIFSAVFVVLIMIYDLFFKDDSKLYKWAYSLIVAGAIGNLVDRICFSFVRDFISMFSWYVCNIADILIFFGVILYIVFAITDFFKKKKEKTNDKTDSW